MALFFLKCLSGHEREQKQSFALYHTPGDEGSTSCGKTCGVYGTSAQFLPLCGVTFIVPSPSSVSARNETKVSGRYMENYGECMYNMCILQFGVYHSSLLLRRLLIKCASGCVSIVYECIFF